MDISDVLARLRSLNENLEYLRSKQPQASTIQDYLRNKDLQFIVERALQLAAQICLDIANYFITVYGLNPDRLESIYTVLGREGLIPPDLTQWLSASVRFRNILVHRYLIIDPVKVYAVWQNELDRFDEFARIVTGWVEQAQADDEAREQTKED
jgi:uncharacterized protein YutE (UPF0331/DUF86 family)